MIIEARDTINDNLIGEGVVLLRDHIRSDQIKPIQVVRCTHDRDQKPKVSCIKSKPMDLKELLVWHAAAVGHALDPARVVNAMMREVNRWISWLIGRLRGYDSGVRSCESIRA